MNSILEALKKTSQTPTPETPPAAPSKNFLFEKSPYDSASVYWERRKALDEKGMRRTVRIALILGGASTLLTLVLVVYLIFGGKKETGMTDSLVAANTVAAPAPTPATPNALPQTPPDELYVADLPEPAPDRPIDEPLPLDLPMQDDVAIVEPYATPQPFDLSQARLSLEEINASPRERPSRREPVRPAYRLQGIIWDDQSPVAMINGRSVRTNDKIGEAKVIQITRNSVLLEIDGKRQTLK